MYSRLLGLTTSALILACGATGAVAQNQMAPQSDQQQMQSHPVGQEGAETMGHGGMMGHGMMGGGMTGPMMGRGMMGGGGMMGPPFMMRMIFALMDADGDGTISLEEFQAAHERIFKAMDTNKDGKLTPEEMQAFMHGTR
jgi:EF hand